jgi:serine O-acetyltransferase
MNLLQSIREDVRSILARDPAASSRAMVLLCYPGLYAVWAHRIQHWLWCRNLKLPARILSQLTRFSTGIEIHPGARIGRRLFIDHGSGVVIGETAILGDDITLYQGVTLGGTGKGEGKRHPTLRNGVFVGSNAGILGNITIGENSRVGAGSVVVRDVPPDSTVVGVPAHIVYQAGKRVLVTDPHEVSDPLSDVIVALAGEVKRLTARVEALSTQPGAEFHPELPHPAPALPFTFEKEESAQYRLDQASRPDHVTMGEGI